MLQNTAAEVLGFDEFDEDVFSQQIEEVIVIGDDCCINRLFIIFATTSDKLVLVYIRTVKHTKLQFRRHSIRNG